MVAIAQLVEHLIVVQKVARSSRVSHPIKPRLPSIADAWKAGFSAFSRRSPGLIRATFTVRGNPRRPKAQQVDYSAVHAARLRAKEPAMLSFENDYSATACPQIIARMQQIQNETHPGYGTDDYCKAAASKIRALCDSPESDIWFLTGGTQTNQVVIDSITAQYAGVVCADSAHINTHEAGAIEATGHKVLALPQQDGKIAAPQLDDYCERFNADANHAHMVRPGCVYVSQPTEYGTVYTRAELAALAQVAHDHGMPLFIDGARLGYALTCDANDANLDDLARIADVFTIGGTKVGAMFGEAVVFTRGNTPENFTALVKLHGALLAKGWLLGLQFDTLFTDDLYFQLSKHANAQADKIRQALLDKGYDIAFVSQTNQIFITVTHSRAQELQRQVKLGFMEAVDADHVMLRICTSWATTDDQVAALIALL